MTFQNPSLTSLQDSLKAPFKDISLSVNGVMTEPHLLSVSPFDRSYLYGDSLYEVIRTLRGEPFHLEEHLVRLQDSAKLCQMDLTPFIASFRSAILATLGSAKKKHLLGTDFYCRIVVSRGVGRIGFARQNVLTPPQYVVIVFPLKEITAADLEQGYRLKVALRLRNDPRALDPAMKSGNYLNSLLAFIESAELEHKDGPFDDALLVNHEGFLTEGTTFNIFYIKNSCVVTPPLDIGILQGITRKGVLEQSRALGLETREVLFKVSQLYEADEVFLTSTLKSVFPVVKVDHARIGTGKPGPLTLELRNKYDHWALSHVR